MRLVAVLVGAVALGSFAVRAEDSSGELAGETLRSTVAGKTVFLATPVGSLPINYRSNGTMTGRAAPRIWRSSQVPRATADVGGSMVVSCASSGRFGWTVNSIAT